MSVASCVYLLLVAMGAVHSFKFEPRKMSSSSLSTLRSTRSVEILAEKDTEKIKQWVRKNNNSFSNNLLFGNYAVSYAGAGSQQRGAPAGGSYEGTLGKLIFESTGLFQHLIYPSDEERSNGDVVVVNQVSGRLLSLIPMHVVLYGIARFLDADERAVAMQSCKSEQAGVSLSEKAVEAVFEPPRIMVCFGGVMAKILSLFGFDLTKRNNAGLKSTIDALDTVFQIGPSSSVVLDTPYCTTTLRSGLGARGSEFVFRKLHLHDREEYSRSEMWRAVMDKAPVSLRSVAIAMSFSGAYFGFVGRRLLGLILSVAGVILGFWKGGIVDDDSDVTVAAMMEKHKKP